MSSVDLIASNYSCPTDFTDFHRFRHLAFLVLTNLCHPCHLWTILPPLILVPQISQISSLGILCPTYLCNLCHPWALFLPLILVPQISQISSVACFCPTYLCHPCHLWINSISNQSSAIIPVRLRTSVSSVDLITSTYSCPTDFTDFVSMHSLSYLICVIRVICGLYYLQ